MLAKPICNKTCNDCVVGKDVFVMMGGKVEDCEGIVHEGALGVHVDEACDSLWGCKEATFEHVGVEFLAFGEVCGVGT